LPNASAAGGVRLSPKQLRIAVVCQAKHEGCIDSFLAKFLDGIPAASSGSRRVPRYGDGFVRRLALGKPRVTSSPLQAPRRPTMPRRAAKLWRARTTTASCGT
jgi:hypothetical protein